MKAVVQGHIAGVTDGRGLVRSSHYIVPTNNYKANFIALIQWFTLLQRGNNARYVKIIIYDFND